MLTLSLDCTVDNSVPQPVPIPLQSWYKDGELVSSAQIHESTEPIMSFVMANQLLMMGVFDFSPLQVLLGGTLVLTTTFTNITNPMLGQLSPDTTIAQARELLFETFLGNWTCLVNNSLGSSSVEYIVREYGRCFLLIIQFYIN